MERIFAGEVYDIVAQPNSIVFSYCKESKEDHVVVGYKMLSLDNNHITDVAKNIYQLSKFGSNYRSVAALCNNYVTARALVLPTTKVFLVEDDGSATLFDTDGSPIYKGDVIYRGNTPSDIAVYKNTIWACYPKANVLLRFNLTTMREELRIGGSRSPFERPNDIFVDGDYAIISSTGSNKLIKVELSNYSVEDYKEFTEPVYGYVKLQSKEFVLMESGLYVL